MKLYSICLQAQSINDVSTSAFYTSGPNEEEAIAKALHICFSYYPDSKGWSDHDVCVTEIPSEFINKTHLTKLSNEPSWIR